LGAGALPPVLLVGGEAVDGGLWAGLGAEGGCEAYNLYGPTEATVDAAACRVRGRGRPGLGRPLANVQAYVLGEGFEPAAVGVCGELYVGGEGLARGYLNRPSLTAERFVPDPFGTEPGSRLYRTGDVCRWDEGGELEYVGRVDGQVKVRGYRVEPGEVEAALRRHAGVREAAVGARADGAGGVRLVAYVVPEAGRELATAALRSHLSELLPEHMVPSAFVTLERLPLTPNGKVDRAALPDPESLAGDGADRIVAPRTPTEELLAGVWCEVLGVGRVSVGDNFFELGGHSLLATRLVSRVRELFKVEMPLRALFETPTVEGLARAVEALLRDAGAEEPLPPVEPVPHEGPLPLSFAQQRLWFIDQLEPGSAFYNSPGAMRLVGPLDVDALGRALSEIVRRHEVLRTRFGSEGGEPYQVVEEPSGVELGVTDLSYLGEAEREAEVLRLAAKEARRPFDLSRGQLLRVGLLRLAADEHVLLLTMHHIASDAWSLGVLVREAASLYEAFAAGKPSPLPELPVQYADFAVWQRRYLTNERLEAQLAYWRRQLTGAPPAMELPGAKPRPAAQGYRGAHASFRVNREITEGLRAVGREEGATLFMVMLAGFSALLSHYTGERDVVVGTDVANRTRGETEALIGFFVNQLVLRTDLAGDPAFRELVSRAKEVCLGAYAHQDLPFERVVEELQPERTLSHTPLFQVKLLLQNAPSGAVEVPGLRMEALRSDSGAARFDLTVAAYESDGGLAVSMQYNAEVYGAEVMERLSNHYCALLEGAARDPSLPLSRLPVMGEAERRRLLVELNETASDYPRGRAAHELFVEQARRTPDAVAVACDGERLTYRELDERSNRLARYLRALGVGPDFLVGLCMERSAGLLEAALGVLKAGGAYLPLDPGYPAQHLGGMLSDSDAAIVLTEGAAAGRLPTHWGLVISLDEVGEEVGAHDPGPLENVASPDNLAYVIYTSGSTGRPKGVMVTHGGLTNYLSWCVPRYTLEGGRGTLWHTSFSFDLCVTSVYAPLLCGQAVEILPARNDVEALVRTLREREGYSFIKLTPAHLSLLASQLKGEEVEGLTGAMVVGGENLLAETVSFWRRHAPGMRIVNEYGPTETVVGSCVYEVAEGDGHEGSIPIGRPLANTQAYVLDARMEPVPVGVSGELYLGGDGLARGYLGRPALTAERFVPDPYGPPGSRLYRTGDVCRWGEAGQMEFMGRADEQVKVRGFRVEPGEVETALCRHPAVLQAVVAARGGEGPQSALVAYCVTGEAEAGEGAGGTLGKELRAYLAERLPPYMVPSAFVMLDQLPLTPNGKVDRAALPEPERTTVGYVAPRTPTEELLAGVWGEVLNVERVSVEDNFFELGGHSLLATMLVSRVRELFDVELPLRALFDHPTVAEIATILEERIIAEVEQLSDEEVAARLSGVDELAGQGQPENAAGTP
ncbi:MAG TPA: amino acid adenylation domain-containing protein, partial [Pyrinomonadaceae bacterium]|nr:amino acid adenylation domain-containing protein [Pyrinomonadaceae bacterium]